MPRVDRVETFIVSIPRETPYLGPVGPDDRQTPNGYLVRAGNRSIYPTTDMSVLVKVTCAEGLVGWGETYGIAAPQATRAIIDELLAPVILGRDAGDPAVIQADLYDLMRVRGFFGGYFMDAIAGLDIALWDAAAKAAGLPLAKMLGGVRRDRLPAYVSGLPRAALDERVALALDWRDRGFRAVKFAAAVSYDGVVAEAAALREALGPEIALMVDLHWRHTAAEAVALLRRLEPYDLVFAEAPCQPEDVEGLAHVAATSPVPIAAGEEWRTVFEVRPRLERRACSILQPEIGHTGVTQFMAIARMAEAFHCRVIPHASIGIGVFMAASLHASAGIAALPWHEYQHSIFDRNLRFVTGDMACADGFYRLPRGPGLGVEPSEAAFEHILEDA